MSVEHIGSTAISGLIARPVIDLVAAVNTAGSDLENAVQQARLLIEGLNFRATDASWCDAVVLQKPRSGEATHRVFLTTENSPLWQSTTGIRDRLQEDRELALRFEETKVARWRAGEGDIQRYEADKAIFFTHLIDQLGGQGT